MSPEKVWSTLEFYDKELGAKQFIPVRQMTEIEYREKYPGVYTILSHCRWMARKCLEVFKVEFESAMAGVPQPDRYGIVPADDVVRAREPLEKSMRWLAYIQGVCNANGIYSCNELRDHSREEIKEPSLRWPAHNPPLTPTRRAEPSTPAIPATPPEPPGGYGASSDADWDAE